MAFPNRAFPNRSITFVESMERADNGILVDIQLQHDTKISRPTHSGPRNILLGLRIIIPDYKPQPTQQQAATAIRHHGKSWSTDGQIYAMTGPNNFMEEASSYIKKPDGTLDIITTLESLICYADNIGHQKRHYRMMLKREALNYDRTMYYQIVSIEDPQDMLDKIGEYYYTTNPMDNPCNKLNAFVQRKNKSFQLAMTRLHGIIEAHGAVIHPIPPLNTQDADNATERREAKGRRKNSKIFFTL